MSKRNQASPQENTQFISIERAEDVLAPFLVANRGTDIDLQSEDGEQHLVVKNPWKDSSLVFSFLATEKNLLEIAPSLNHVYLPERYTAIWHADTKDLEFIWTAFPVESTFVNRKINLLYGGKKYECEFSKASNRLLKIADIFYPAADTETRYRNLVSFDRYNLNQKQIAAGNPPLPITFGEPICFWIRGIEWEEILIAELVPHINFYLKYYDAKSPVVLTHSPEASAISCPPRQRYKQAPFPSLINARQLDENLLRFWEASREGDEARQFLYSYRIIEYASDFCINEEVRANLRRLLLAPNALDQIERTINDVVICIPDDKRKEETKVDLIMQKAVAPSVLWKEIVLNKSAFVSKTVFDGGFYINPFINNETTEDQFNQNGVAQISGVLRGIRNALAHGRDKKTAGVITPTPYNFRCLHPWAILASVSAAEVILYNELP